MDQQPIPENSEFRALAERALGRDWIERLARATGVNIGTAQQWATHKRVVSEQAWGFLRNQEAIIAKRGLRQRLQAWVDDVRADGLASHRVFALLRDTADQIVGMERRGEAPAPEQE